MSSLLAPSRVSSEETTNERRGYLAITVIVALAMFLAASGSGSGDFVGEPPPDALNIAGNVFAATIGIMVLIPRTRIYGAILAVGNMFISMYVNYTYDGVDYFVDLIPYNVITIMLASILIGHYEPDLVRTRPSYERDDEIVVPEEAGRV